jgi:putative PEP-CTERM system histidine kinase
MELLSQAGLISHLVAALAFGGLALWLALRPAGAPGHRLLVLAAALTALWAGLFAAAAAGQHWALDWLPASETLRSAAWLLFPAVLLARGMAPAGRRTSPLWLLLGLAIATQLGIELVARTSMPTDPAVGGLMAWTFQFARLAVAIGGLLLVHNLYVNTATSSRWAVQLLCIALAALFAYDLNLYTWQLLTGRLDADLINMRGAAIALTVPLFVASVRRTRKWELKISRQVAFTTFSLAGVGGYLMLMSLLGYGLSLVGGDWGRLLQISLIFGGLLLAAVVVGSGRFRAWARVQIAKHFFSYKHDYREVWLRFVNTVARPGEQAEGTLGQRVIQAVGELVSSPGGLLFTPDGQGGFALDARLNDHSREAPLPPGHPLIAHMAATGRVVNLDAARAGQGEEAGLALPDWLTGGAFWLVVPLLHLNRLDGFIVLRRPLAEQTLNWEDFDLLRMAGRQAASYIAESRSQAELSEARKFDEFNRRFAFIMHDIKNIVSQLALVARNAQRHADNPEFRADMVATLTSSAERMRALLDRLGQHSGARPAETGRVALDRLVLSVAEAKRRFYPHIQVEGAEATLWLAGDAGRLEQAIEHLVQNAIDASQAPAPVRLRLRALGGEARLEIEDRGCGMSAAFIRDELFKPFHSTKPGGFGIGAYESREIIRRAGGRLDVASRVGEGTLFTIHLPLAEAGARAQAA